MGYLVFFLTETNIRFCTTHLLHRSHPKHNLKSVDLNLLGQNSKFLHSKFFLGTTVEMTCMSPSYLDVYICGTDDNILVLRLSLQTGEKDKSTNLKI